jgi:N-formylglutamate amidohydrolase
VVSRNAPFAGAFVAQRYGRPSRGWHAVQIEIDRSLYMNERMIRPNGNFETVKRIVTSVLARAIEATPGAMPLAAE